MVTEKQLTDGFDAVLEITNETAFITLSGELNARTAGLFQTQVEKAIEVNIKRLVLMSNDLEFMASAGVRALLQAVQAGYRKGLNLEIYVVGAQPMILDTIKTIGLAQTVIMVDKYESV